MRKRKRHLLLPALAAALAAATLTATPLPAHAATLPWMNTAQTPAQRAQELLAAMTVTQELDLLHGSSSCDGYAACVDPQPSLDIPQLRLQDGPAGVGDGATGVTQLPAPVAGAASWDTALMKQYGGVIGSEAWGKGVNVVLGPTINIDRDPRWGRSFESLSEDPYLAGQLAAADIQGIQGAGPMAQVKHFAVYNQETNRNNTSDDAVVSARAEQEIYLPAFQAAVTQGKADSVMCSYAEINGTFACENSNLLQTILEGQMGFTGFVTSDWGATHDTTPTINNGLDMEMNGDTYYGAPLTTDVSNGTVSKATIDGHVLKILTAMFAAGLFDVTQTGTPSTVVTSAADTAVATQVDEEGSVLLQNTGSVLPLGSSTKSIAVIGDDAGDNALTAGGGSAHVDATSIVTPEQGISTRAAAAGDTVTYAQGVADPNGSIVQSQYLTPSTGSGNGLSAQYFTGNSLSGSPIATSQDPELNFTWGGQPPVSGVPGDNWSAKWTGTLTPPTTGTYQFSLTSDDGSRLYVNGQQVINNWADQPATTQTGSIALTAGQPVSVEVDYFQDGGGSQLQFAWQVPNQDLIDPAVAAAKAANTAVVFVDNPESEGADLPDIDLSSAQNQLVSAVAAANPNTVVVVNSGSAVTMPWANSVKGIIENWYPGQTDGTAIAALLFGDVDFSGKLPVTFPQSLADVPASTPAQWPGQNGTVQYSEGIDVGYRWYDSQNKTPLFPFGFGLSYTSFGYSGLTLGAPDGSGNVKATFTVTNTGSKAGTDVAQLYVGEPSSTGEPPKSLAGFQRVTLNPGQSQQVSITVAARSFQYWGTNGWINAAGVNTVYVGDSSRSLPLSGQVTISGGSPTTGTLAASPTSLGFAGQTVGTTSAAQTDTITNTGSAAVAISSVTTTGDFAQTGTCSGTLAAGASCTASVTFTPTATGSRTGTLTVTSNATNSPLTVSVNGTGTAASTTNLALGATMTSSGYTQTYTPSSANDNNTNTYWESTNSAFPQWLQADLGSNQSEGSITLTLPPSTSWATRTQTLSVQGSTDGSTFTALVASAGYTFNPATGNAVTIALPSGTDDRYLRLNITANTGWPAGQISEFEIFPGGGGGGGTTAATLTGSVGTLTFPAQAQGTTSAAQTVTITNTGTAAASVGSVSASGDFAQTDTCGAAVAAGASCTASVTFTPTATGSRTGTLTLTSNASNSPLTVSLSGTGTASSSTNIALGATMTSSGYTQTYTPSNANDNNTSTYWESTDNAFPQWLQADLGSSQPVGSITLTLPPSTSWSTRTQTLSVLGSTDGSTYTTLVASAGYTFNPATGNTVTIALPAGISERYLKLDITANTGWTAGQVSEFEIFP
jgi:beta-glucosidase